MEAKDHLPERIIGSCFDLSIREIRVNHTRRAKWLQKLIFKKN